MSEQANEITQKEHEVVWYGLMPTYKTPCFNLLLNNLNTLNSAHCGTTRSQNNDQRLLLGIRMRARHLQIYTFNKESPRFDFNSSSKHMQVLWKANLLFSVALSPAFPYCFPTSGLISVSNIEAQPKPLFGSQGNSTMVLRSACVWGWTLEVICVGNQTLDNKFLEGNFGDTDTNTGTGTINEYLEWCRARIWASAGKVPIQNQDGM